jgi:hypothetical protein
MSGARTGQANRTTTHVEVKGQHTTEHARTLERSLEVTFSRLSKNMNPDGLGVVDAFQPHDRLGEQRLRELEIEVHDTHESNAQVYRAELGVR